VSDKYESVRSLPFPALASALGIDMARFKRRQADWQGFCPIHQSKTNNNCFAYNDDGRFHCFSCNAKGRGAIDLTKLVKNIGFQAAVEFLGAVPPPPKEKAALAVPIASGGVLQPLAKDTWRKFAVPSPWLEARIPDATVRERYSVFCYNNPARKSAYSGRVMLPVKDLAGLLYGYLGRCIADNSGDTAKYLFPRNLPKSHFLFGSAEILAGTFGPAPLRVVYLVESPFCVMKFAMYGLPALSPFGWSVSPEQLELLTHLAKGTVYLPDRNKSEQGAGIVAALAARLWVRFPPLPDGCDDPEQLTKEQVLALTH
jgi:DNA primase